MIDRGGAQVVPRPATWAPGPPPPWPLPADAPSLDQVVAALEERRRPAPLEPAFTGARHSAVLVVVADGPLGAEVLLTKRSMQLRHHRGEISFPGGRMDPGETPLQTAVREAVEEVGLEPTAVESIGELTHVNTVISRSYIVPQVVRIGERPQLAPASPEVDHVWWQPLGELLDSRTYRSEVWGTPPTDRIVHFFELPGETVWGATARMLVDLLGTVVNRPIGR